MNATEYIEIKLKKKKEEELNKQLTEFNQQLDQVNVALTQLPDNDQLLQAKKELTDLIKMNTDLLAKSKDTNEQVKTKKRKRDQDVEDMFGSFSESESESEIDNGKPQEKQESASQSLRNSFKTTFTKPGGKIMSEKDLIVNETNSYNDQPKKKRKLNPEKDKNKENKTELNGKEYNEFGSWEKHTDSIGSKLLLSMGWKLGQPIGLKKDGIVDPIQIQFVLPKNQLLGLGHESRLKNIGDEKKKKEMEFKKKNEEIKRQNDNVFTFMEKKLSLGSKKPENVSLEGKATGQLNKHLDSNTQKTTKMKQKIAKLNIAFQRNKIKEPEIASQIKKKIEKYENMLKNTEGSKKEIEKRLELTQKQKFKF